MNQFAQSVFAEAPEFCGYEAELDAVLGPVSEYPIFGYSMNAVKRAGIGISDRKQLARCARISDAKHPSSTDLFYAPPGAFRYNCR
jgi:hypothetical protein